MKKMILSSILFSLLMSGIAQAALTTIGTATYEGNDYKLIWDDDNNGNSVVWLDYSNSGRWATQVEWAAGLAAQLTINLEGYTIAWKDDAWRLPTTVDGIYEYGCDGTTTGGFNITTSELGHLFYEELGNQGYRDTSGNIQSPSGLQNTEDFDNLKSSYYWSGTAYTASSYVRAWGFYTRTGEQVQESERTGCGLALRSGQVSAVPLPGTVWLFGIGLTGLAALRRRGKGMRI